jgi:hypothetical protein
MKNLLLAVALMSGGAAFAQGWRGGHGGHHYGGGGGHYGGYHGARPVYVAPRPVYVAPRPVYVAPRPVYSRPIYVAPPRYRSYGYRYGYVAPAPGISFALPLGAVSLYIGAQPYFLSSGTFYLQSGNGYSAVAPPIGAAVSSIPPDAMRQEINGYTYAMSNGAWFIWDGNQGAWVVVNSPY